MIRAKRKRRLPTVMSKREARAILSEMDGVSGLVARMLYGTGMRLLEALQLRAKDIDFERHQILVREPKGGRDRSTLLPNALVVPLRAQLEHSRAIHETGRELGDECVEIPHGLGRKYPAAERSWPWFWVFPASRTYRDSQSGKFRRHHYHESMVQRSVREAAMRIGIAKKVTCHTFRHSFATHLLESGYV